MKTHHKIIKNIKRYPPLLLLDDIYDKLDEHRFRKLIDLVSSEAYGQVFITDTHAQRIEHLFNNSSVGFSIYNVNNAEITSVKNA